MTSMKHILIASACVLALAACQTTTAKEQKLEGKREPLEITGGVSGPVVPEYAPDDPRVQMYKTEGDFQNPLDADRTHSVLDNTTAGGYTVFDESVKVYPLPGDDVPAYVPSYAVPPLKGQYKKEPPLVGQRPMGLASAGMLPPVPNVEVVEAPEADPYANPPVSGAVRKPLSLTSPEPLVMQPPSQARPPVPSPFMKAAPAAPLPDDMGMMTSDEMAVDTMAAPQPSAQSSVTTAGRRSSPLLTGY